MFFLFPYKNLWSNLSAQLVEKSNRQLYVWSAFERSDMWMCKSQ